MTREFAMSVLCGIRVRVACKPSNSTSYKYMKTTTVETMLAAACTLLGCINRSTVYFNMGPDSAALKEWGGGARSGAAAFGAPKLFGMEKFYVLCITETRKMCV